MKANDKEEINTHLTFKLGKQPIWAGKEDNVLKSLSFIKNIINQNNIESLINRGYCITKLPNNTIKYYSLFHKNIKQFFNLDNKTKQKYALLQFESRNNSPNQCHGYSEVASLKEQFMMRCTGYNKNNQFNNDDLIFPTKDQFGFNGVQIYQNLDMICRNLAKDCMKQLHKNPKCVDDILDPIHKVNGKVEQINDNCYSEFMPNGYISSSIMDNFHYYKPSQQKSERFHNNHSSHTDSGLMTAVVCTDVPGLEILDQKEKVWIQIEELIHEYATKNNENHRQYCTFFWSDSVEYLNNAKSSSKNDIKLNACFHRVANCNDERYSVVFKQRTSPLRTHCRYQEDYILASIQKNVDKYSKNAYTLWKKNDQIKLRNMYLKYIVIIVFVMSFVFMFINKFM